MSQISRRDFLKISAQGAGAAVLSYGLMGCSNSNEEHGTGQFMHGIASGDPTHDGIILWTRVTTEQTDAKVAWQIATDSGFNDIVNSGDTVTDASRDFTVKIDAQGLSSGMNYYYRFSSGDAQSESGMFKTLPQGSVAQVKLAVVSCANYPAGYFNVYQLAAKQVDADALIHLGDYIYEYDRQGFASDQAEQLDRQVLPAHELLSLADYRQRYSQYRSDTDLQLLHSKLAFISVWDDHEVANDAWLNGAENHQADEGDFDLRKEAALQAYFEWMPIRPWRNDEHDDIYRSFNFGDLVDLHMLDTRLKGRDQQVDFNQFIDPATGAFDGDNFTQAITDSNRTMLGQTQMLWLQGTLLQANATWQVLGQQVLMGKMLLPAAIATQQLSISQYAMLGELAQLAARVAAGDPSLTAAELAYLQANQHLLTAEVLALLQLPNIPYNLDAWDGYSYEREVIFGTARSRQQNLVVLAGDTHNAWGSNLVDVDGNAVGVEFATSSVTSPGLEYYLQIPEAEVPATEAGVVSLVKDLQYANLFDRGYMTVTFTPEKAQSDWYFVDTILNHEYQMLTDRQHSMSCQRDSFKLS
ncbi:alkaline phosphatase D family protein [Shewanella marina]|uniref:alkaline phosphatase D family protein n=1 Tax=Shewanella marina TaxID=487319 RepID=UPI00047099D3|nr:alkaline phosphatase D family protein [Shewanella marina]